MRRGGGHLFRVVTAPGKRDCGPYQMDRLPSRPETDNPKKVVQRMRKEIGLPKEFTLDVCRHGGMTELEEAELTEGQGRALSAHRTRESYAGYAKRTEAGMLSATR